MSDGGQRPQDEPVELAPPSGHWAGKFAAERETLAQALAPLDHRIEHIGSTAVEGLPCKPVVDIAVKITDLSLIPDLVPLLAHAGYKHMGEHGVPGRHFFIKGEPRHFHLHIVDGSTDHRERWIVFRQMLAEDESVRRQYIQLKQELMEKYAHQRPKYTAGKSDFIDRLVERRLYGR